MEYGHGGFNFKYKSCHAAGNLEKTETPVQEKETKIIIYFPLNEWDVKNLFAGEKDKLNALIDNFLKDKTQQGLFIYGYADRTGLRSYNVSVSKKRAQNIAEFLSSKTGIEMNKIVAEGKGEILKGPDGVNNPLFRKVEIIIISGTP